MKLQNNFTTVEQSKRLLELGLPRWTADMYHWSRDGHHNRLWWGIEFQRLDEPKNFDTTDIYGYHLYYPYWSVGRLIEIAWICLDWLTFSMRMKRVFHSCISEKAPFVEAVVNEFDTKFDFSKLED